MPSNLDYEMETLMGVLDQIQVCMCVYASMHAGCHHPRARRSCALPCPSSDPRMDARVPRQTAVGGKVEKKAKEGGGKVDKFMDLKQTMIGAFVGKRLGRLESHDPTPID